MTTPAIVKKADLKPYTASSLAARWECSEGLIYKLIAQGQLHCFRLGTLIRISHEEVERFECSPCNDSEADSPKSIETVPENDTDEPWTPQIAKGRRRRPAGSGQRGRAMDGAWAA